MIEIFAAAETYSLVKLDVAKDELGVAIDDSSQDDRISRYIAEASSIVASACRRVFPVEGVTERFYLPHFECHHHALRLSRKPLTKIVLNSTSADTAMGTFVLPFSGIVGIAIGMPVSGPGIAPGTVVADFDTITLTLSLATIADIPSDTEIACGISVYMDGATSCLIYGEDYRVNRDDGILWKTSGHWSGKVVASYFAGYDPIPADVAGATLRVVSMLYGQRGRDPMERSIAVEGLDSVSYRDVGAGEDDMRAFIQSRLANYMPPQAFA